MRRVGMVWGATIAFWALIAWWVGSWPLFVGATVFFTLAYVAVYGFGNVLERRQRRRP